MLRSRMECRLKPAFCTKLAAAGRSRMAMAVYTMKPFSLLKLGGRLGGRLKANGNS